MEKISIFNYEAYYLDYLEGNLSEEDSALLLAFLEANPDLKLEDEDLDNRLESPSELLDSKSKSGLLQYGEEDEVTLDSIEFFMISAKEGILSPAKEAEVFAFLDAHPKVEKDWLIYQHTTLEADSSIRYADKEELKQKTAVLWPYVSFAAAASVAALIMFWPAGGTQVSETGLGYLAGNLRSVNSTTFVGHEHPGISIGGNTQVTDVQAGNPNNANTLTLDNYYAENRQTPVNSLNHRPAGSVLAAFNDIELQPIAKTTFAQDENAANGNVLQNENSDMASARELEMHNPIEPFTRFVGEKTNTDIEFRKSDKGAEGNKGFYLKIGKFELSRKKH